MMRQTVYLALGLLVSSAAAQVQVNTPDHNLGTLDNSTTQSETSHALDGGTAVVGWNDSSEFAVGGLGGLTSLSGFGYSTDGGLTFTDSGLLAPLAGWILTGDPCISRDSAGTFYYASMALNGLGDSFGNIVVAASAATSPAVLFGAPVTIPRLNAAGTIDKELMAIDNSGGTFDGRIYIAWTEFVGAAGRLVFTRSTSTAPLAFAAPVQLSAADAAVHQGAVLAAGPSGELYVAWGRFVFAGSSVTSQEIHVIKSTDGGVTFANPDPADPAPTKVVATPTPAADNMLTGGVDIRSRGFPYIAVDQTPIGSLTRANVYIVFQGDPDGTDPDRSDIFFVRSTDGGANWATPRSITSGPAVTIGRDVSDNDNWQPAIAAAPNGHISVSFYDRRDDTTAADGDPANMKIALYKAFSTDAGMAWCNAQLCPGSFTPATGYDPLINPLYMGDYNWASADTSGFQYTWGDCRNTVTNPPGAPDPATPVGRPDQDVLFFSEPGLTGPDLFITPWGYVSGEGPTWQTPDIFVVDVVGNEINASKGAVNRLQARVKNLGDTPAVDVEITFRFAPWFAGITDAAIKTIGTVTESFLAGETKAVEIHWDLTDLTDTNGGLWPNPLGDFDHFCMKVDIEHPEDINTCNNNAQNNFNDVPTVSAVSVVRFLVGNPLRKEARARLIMRELPRGYKVRLEGLDASFGKPFALKPGELRTAVLRFEPPRGGGGNTETDLVARLDFEIDGEVVGGLSARLAKAQEKQTHDERIRAPIGDVFRAILAMLKAREEPVSLASEKRWLINTGSIPLSKERLAASIKESARARVKGKDGRLIVSFKLTRVDARTTDVEVTVLILANVPAGGPLGGMAMPSNGSLEQGYLGGIRRSLR